MKRFIGRLGLVAFCFSFIGCGLLSAVIPTVIPTAPAPQPESTITTEKEGLYFMMQPATAKGFEIVGIIFISSSAKINPRGEVVEGSDITFDMLMKEVLKLGGDDFVNLRIDERKTSNVDLTIADYKATALAIKYK